MKRLWLGLAALATAASGSAAPVPGFLSTGILLIRRREAIALAARLPVVGRYARLLAPSASVQAA